MFGNTKLVTPCFQQITLRSKILKIIYISLQKWTGVQLFLGGVRIILERSVNYLGNFGGSVFLKNKVC